MKKILGLVLVLFALPVLADNYMGASIGRTMIEDSSGLFDDDATGAGIFAGTDVGSISFIDIDAEAGLFYTGEVTDGTDELSATADAMAFNVGITAGIDLLELKGLSIGLFVPFGYSLWDGELALTCGESGDQYRSRGQGGRNRGCRDIDYDGEDHGYYYGVGLNIGLGSKWFTRVSYTRYDVDFDGLIDDPERAAIDVGFKF